MTITKQEIEENLCEAINVNAKKMREGYSAEQTMWLSQSALNAAIALAILRGDKIPYVLRGTMER